MVKELVQKWVNPSLLKSFNANGFILLLTIHENSK